MSLDSTAEDDIFSVGNATLHAPVDVNQHALDLPPQSLLLVGPPEACRGFVSVKNPAKQGVRLRTLTVSLDSTTANAVLENLVRPRRERAAPAGTLVARTNVRIAAGEEREAEITLSLKPTTPPGRYQGVLVFGSGPQPVTIEVQERRRGRMTPRLAIATVAPGATMTLGAIVANRGNRDFFIDSKSAVRFRPEDRSWNHHFHAAAHSEGGAGYESFLSDFVARMGRDEPPVSRIEVVHGAGELAAGASRALELQLAVPRELNPGRIYRAEAALGHARFKLRLHT